MNNQNLILLVFPVLLLFSRFGMAQVPSDEDIPLDKLNPVAKRVASQMTEKNDIDVTFPGREVTSSVQGYEFLLDRLPLTAELVRKMDMGSYRIKPGKNDNVIVRDGEGVKLKLVPLYSQTGFRMYYTRGYWENPIIPTIYGRGMVLLQYSENDDGTIKTGARLYFQVDSDFYDSLSGLLEQFVKATLKKKVKKFISAAESIARMVEEKPEKVQKAMNKASYANRKTRKTFTKHFYSQTKEEGESEQKEEESTEEASNENASE